MDISLRFKKLVFFVLFITLPVFVISCTSSEDDSTALEEELENVDGDEAAETMADDLEDLDDIAEEDLEDIVDEEDALDGDDDGTEVADSDEEGEGDEEFDEEEEFEDEEGEEEFAENDEVEEGEDGEISDEDFAEFDDEEEPVDELDQSEEGLAKEIEGQDYPVAENAEPQFPEEVMKAGEAGQNPPPPPGDMVAGGPPVITSDTKEIAVADEPIEPSLPNDDLGEADPIVPLDDDAPMSEPTWIPVVKIKTDPFFRNGRLMNAVYIARPGESMSEISEKLFKEDRSKELNADNPHLAKGIDPGDKVYYNSPNRSDDKSDLKFYYSDIGLPAQFYKTKANDNMRRLGSKLLGFPDGWKEVWAINPSVDSKTILPSGIELRYWTGNETKPELEVADIDENDPSQTFDDGMGAGSSGEIEDMGEPELPPEPPLPDETQVAMPEPTLEPEPVPDIEPFPEEGVNPTPGPAVNPAQVAAQKEDDSLLTVAAIALLGMAMVGLVAIQIKKRKDNTGLNPQSLEYTQV